ncbi:sensor histidine kinase [Chondrinema litorale]|uniref:sensor histidine kinase n=1 Tax=Chondrinema litorale TaxID=2994555 RepID=UPI0025431F52|nr:histidine kinase [Chondrinema litorale]UZR96531.1 histidine kinase [Chondrinema litorale]
MEEVIEQRRTFNKIQIGAWLLFFVFQLTFYWAEYQQFYAAFIFSVFNVFFYASFIYLCYLYLIPTFQNRKNRGLIIALGSISILVFTYLWTYSTYELYNYLYPNREEFTIKWYNYLYRFITVMSLLAFSILLRYTQSYFHLLGKSKMEKLKQTEAELDRLKFHIQPHFLFNTLNNIYYVTESESPKAAEMLSKLSDMMRYFIEESKKQKVIIATEINFINNYINLENIRMRFLVQVQKKIEVDELILVPPMLLIPFIENVFKHGIQKNETHNVVDISIKADESYLFYTVTNSLKSPLQNSNERGFGLRNLKARLSLLYDKDYEMSTTSTDSYFTAMLKIPIR